MVQINMGSKEITLKVVYYGPALSGKTSNLQKLHEMMDPARRSHMLTLDTKDDRTLYFDFDCRVNANTGRIRNLSLKEREPR